VSSGLYESVVLLQSRIEPAFSFGKGGKAFGVQRRKCVAAMVERWRRQRLRKPRVSGVLRSLGKGGKAGRADHLRQK